MTLDELKRLDAAAAPPKWYVGPEYGDEGVGDDDEQKVMSYGWVVDDANLALAAAARNALPLLIAVAEAAKAIGCRGSEEFNPEQVRLADALAALEAP